MSVVPATRWVAGVTLAVASGAVVAGGAYRPTELPEFIGTTVAAGAAVMSAVMVGVCIARPWWGLLLFVAAMPIVNVARAQVWIGAVQIIPATLVIAALALGAVLQRFPSSAPDAPPPPGRRAWLFLGLGAGLALAASLAAPSMSDAANITLHGVLEPMVVFAVVIWLRPSPTKALHALMALTVGVIVGTVINLAWLGLFLVPRDLYDQRMLLARLTYFNAGIFGNMLVMAIPAAASLYFLRSRFRRPRLAASGAWLTIGVMIVALFFTYTKSAWLSAALVASLTIVLLVQAWRHRVPLLLVVAVLLALVVPYPLPVLRAVAPDVASGYQFFLVTLQGQGRLESWDPETYHGSGSIGIRLESIGAAAELTAGSPLLGVGPGGFQREFARIRPDASVPGLQSAHNLLPNLAAEYGLPFMLLVAIGLLWSIRAGLRTRLARASVPRVVGTLLGISLIGFLCLATLFGVDLYRTYRTMNLDVVTAALLTGLTYSVARAGQEPQLVAGASPRPDDGEPVDQTTQLGAAGQDEVASSRP
jgi:O-antigen ligase